MYIVRRLILCFLEFADRVPYCEAKKVFLVLFSCLFITGCSNDVSAPVVHAKCTIHTELLMGTIVEISVWGDTQAPRLIYRTNSTGCEFVEIYRLVEEGFNEIARIEDKFSIYKETSELSKVNRDNTTAVNGELKYLFRESEKYRDITGGAFDINYKKNGSSDLGAIAKGYAADRAAEIFRKNGVGSAMINIGGNLYLLGVPPDKDCWTIGIRDPKNPDKQIGRIMLSGECGVATSGDYERPGHIKNPQTGLSETLLLSVTITAKSAMEADVLSTGVYVMGAERGMDLIEKLPDVEGVIISEGDGEIRIEASSGLKDRFVKL